MLLDPFYIHEIRMVIKIYLFLLIMSYLYLLMVYLSDTYNIFSEYDMQKSVITDIKSCILLLISLISVSILFLVIFLLYFYYNIFIYNSSIITLDLKNYILFINILNLGNLNIFICSINKFNLTFILLFSFLYPIICVFMSYDFNYSNSNKYIYMYTIFILSYFLLIIENIILFYFIYELLLLLVFYSMYLTSNSRGAVEASLFFAGWAVLGSILVGLGFLILIVETNYTYFFQFKKNKLTLNETYYIYILFFLGFGVKLSI